MVDACQVALESNLAVFGRSVDLEELGQRRRAITVKNGQPLDLGKGHSGQLRGQKPADFQREGICDAGGEVEQNGRLLLKRSHRELDRNAARTSRSIR
jgi:hypothetical protein